MRRFLLLLAAPLLAQQIPFDRLTPLFDYDASRPLDARTTVIRQEPGAKISELSYVSPSGIVFGHWDLEIDPNFCPKPFSARAGGLDRDRLPLERPAEFRRVFPYEDSQKDLDTARQAVVDLRRAIDYPAARPDVDSSPIAYIGHSYGAQSGAILSAVSGGASRHVGEEQRAGDGPIGQQWLAEKRHAYLDVYSQLDGIRYVPDAAPVAVYFQFARFDRYFNEQSMNSYFAAAGEPERIGWYPTGHDLNDPAAWVDRAAPALGRAMK